MQNEAFFKHERLTENGAKAIVVGHKGSAGQKGFIFSGFGIAPCLPATQYKDPTLVVIDDGTETDSVRQDTSAVGEDT